MTDFTDSERELARWLQDTFDSCLQKGSCSPEEFGNQWHGAWSGLARELQKKIMDSIDELGNRMRCTEEKWGSKMLPEYLKGYYGALDDLKSHFSKASGDEVKR